MFSLRFACALACALTPLAAQRSQADAPKRSPQTSEQVDAKARAKAIKKRRAEIRTRIQRERARRRSATVVRTHVAVRVKLRNGERLRGVVKDGNFVERPSGGLEFVRGEMTQKDAGLRLWYYNRTDGYIFLPYTMIQTYKVLKRLTDVEIKVIRDQIREAESAAKAAGAARRQAIEDKAAGRKAGEVANRKLAKLAKDLEEKKALEKKNAKILALVKEFPPDEGWGEERINKINIRRLTVRVFPNAKERRFIEVFEDWKRGRKLWLDQKAAAAGKDSAGKAGDSAGAEKKPPEAKEDVRPSSKPAGAGGENAKPQGKDPEAPLD